MTDDAGTDRGVPPGYELLGPSDQETVRQLVLRGAEMRQPRHAHHHLLFPSEEATARASGKASAAGWRVSTTEPGDDSGQWMLTCEKDDYILLARIIHADTQFFDSLARAGHGEHDGWEASAN